MRTMLHPPTHLLHRILAIGCVMCMAISMTSCRVFHEEAFRRDVVLEQRDSLPTDPVQPGYAFRSLSSIDAGDLIVVSYRDVDVDATPRIVTGVFDEKHTTESFLALNKVRDTTVPKTLSVAFRNVRQVYPVKQYPSYTTTDAGLTLIWILFGLPALAIGGMLIGKVIAALGIGSEETATSTLNGLDVAINSGSIGFAMGIITWIALSIPIR